MDIIDKLAKSYPAKLELFEAIEVLECEKKLNTQWANDLHCHPKNQGTRTRPEIVNMAINAVLEQLNVYHKLNIVTISVERSFTFKEIDQGVEYCNKKINEVFLQRLIDERLIEILSKRDMFGKGTLEYKLRIVKP